ncbi:hypothetical protein EUX98_g9736, partial [Antrodiella citrinella]
KKPEMKLNVPETLKVLLVDDWEGVTKNNQLITLPRTPNVLQLLDEYRAYVLANASSLQLREPQTLLPTIVAGLQTYFDRALGANLLYRFERPQYAEIRRQYVTGPNVVVGQEKEMSSIYGAEHLLRMLDGGEFDDGPRVCGARARLHERAAGVGVPGAFTSTCNAHIPGYINAYDQFKAKGINDIYVVAVNDVFVVQAWKEHLAASGTPIHFLSDDTGAFVGSMGLLFDPTPMLGSPRSKRFVLVVEGHEITHVAVEPDPTKVTVTGADAVLPLL